MVSQMNPMMIVHRIKMTQFQNKVQQDDTVPKPSVIGMEHSEDDTDDVTQPTRHEKKNKRKSTTQKGKHWLNIVQK